MFHGSGYPAPVYWVDFLIQMREAKRAGVPIHPPVRPVIQNPESLELLGYLLFFHGDAAYRRLLKSEAEGGSTSGFAHRL